MKNLKSNKKNKEIMKANLKKEKILYIKKYKKN